MRWVKPFSCFVATGLCLWSIVSWGQGSEVECGSEALDEQQCPLKIDGSVALLEQISRSSCDQGRTWGYDDDGIWVKGRCHALFRLSPKYAGESLKRPDLSPPEVPANRSNVSLPADQIADLYCASSRNRYQHCDADTQGRSMHLVHEFSDKACDYGRTWGYNSRGIWVDRGCVGIFRMKRRFVPPPRVVRVLCESDGDKRASCPVKRLGHAQLANSYSGENCVRGKSWGLERDAIWVKSGCRALFDVIERGTGMPTWMYGRFEGLDKVRDERLTVDISISGLPKAWRNDRPIHIDIDGDLLLLGGEPYEIAKTRRGFRAEHTLASRFRSVAFQRSD